MKLLTLFLVLMHPQFYAMASETPTDIDFQCQTNPIDYEGDDTCNASKLMACLKAGACDTLVSKARPGSIWENWLIPVKWNSQSNFLLRKSIEQDLPPTFRVYVESVPGVAEFYLMDLLSRTQLVHCVGNLDPSNHDIYARMESDCTNQCQRIFSELSDGRPRLSYLFGPTCSDDEGGCFSLTILPRKIFDCQAACDATKVCKW